MRKKIIKIVILCGLLVLSGCSQNLHESFNENDSQVVTGTKSDFVGIWKKVSDSSAKLGDTIFITEIDEDGTWIELAYLKDGALSKNEKGIEKHQNLFTYYAEGDQLFRTGEDGLQTIQFKYELQEGNILVLTETVMNRVIKYEKQEQLPEQQTDSRIQGLWVGKASDGKVQRTLQFMEDGKFKDIFEGEKHFVYSGRYAYYEDTLYWIRDYGIDGMADSDWSNYHAVIDEKEKTLTISFNGIDTFFKKR